MIDKQAMTCSEVDEVLSEYLEETLPRGVRGRVDEHVAECLRCNAIVRDIDAIRMEAAQLPELSPSRDLWAGIATRIEPAVLPLGIRSRIEVSRRWIPAAAAAAAALVIATAGITYVATSRSLAPAKVAVAPPSAAPATAPAPAALGQTEPTTASGQSSVAASTIPESQSSKASPEPRAALGSAVRSIALASRRRATSPSEIAYGDEIQRLQTIITERRRELDPATVSVIEESLQVIDAAVRQSRAALARDPRSGFLADQLNHALDKKVELLRTVALLPSRT